MKKRVCLLGLLVGVTTAGVASAVSCSISSVSNLNFGTYDPNSGSPNDTLGSLSYNCGLNLLFASMRIDLSQGNAASYSPRQMLSSANTLDYNLYLDASRTQIWGDGGSGTSRFGPQFISSFATVNLTVFGRIPAGQNPHVGSYSDTIVITANF